MDDVLLHSSKHSHLKYLEDLLKALLKRWLKISPRGINSLELNYNTCVTGLICLQAYARSINQWMSGDMLYKPKCVLLNIHKKLQTSCIMTSFGFFLER